MKSMLPLRLVRRGGSRQPRQRRAHARVGEGKRQFRCPNPRGHQPRTFKQYQVADLFPAAQKVPVVGAYLVLRRRSCHSTSEAPGGCPTLEAASARQQGLRADPALIRRRCTRQRAGAQAKTLRRHAVWRRRAAPTTGLPTKSGDGIINSAEVGKTAKVRAAACDSSPARDAASM